MGFRSQVRLTTSPLGAAMPPVRFVGIVGCVAFAAATLLYAMGASYWSGQRVADLGVREGSAFVIGGITLSQTGETANQVGPVALDPAMNPVRVVLHTGYRRLRIGQSVAVAVTLRDPDGNEVWTRNRKFARSSSSRSRASSGTGSGEVSNSSVLETFDVPRAGNYLFDVAVNSRGDDTVRRVSLEVRREVANASPAIVWTGVAAALASLLVGLIVGRASATTPQSGRLAA